MRQGLSNSLVVAKYTLKELMKSQMLWVALSLAVLIALLAWLSAELTFGVPSRVALDVGLGALSLAGYGISIFMGATLISREIESRTIYMVISRPVSREVFFFGKILGLVSFLILNLSILGAAAIGIAWALGASPTWLACCVYLASIFECILLMLVVVLISLGANTSLTVVLSLLLLAAGHAIGETRQAAYVQLRPLLAKILAAYHYIFPGFYKFNLKDLVIYEITPPEGWILTSFIYGLSYAAFLVALICLVIRKKDFN